MYVGFQNSENKAGYKANKMRKSHQRTKGYLKHNKIVYAHSSSVHTLKILLLIWTRINNSKIYRMKNNTWRIFF